MAYFDPHRVFDGLTSYIHSMRRHLLTYTSYAAPLGGGAVNMHDRAVAAARRGLCMPLNHSLHMPTRYNGGALSTVHGGGGGDDACPVIPLVESQL